MPQLPKLSMARTKQTARARPPGRAPRASTSAAPRRPDWITKEPDYFKVEAILGCGEDDNDSTKRWFLIQWSGYRQLTWEPEDHLDGCTGMLDDYIKKHKLEPRKVWAVAGASIDHARSFKRSLWIDTDTIVRFIRTHKAWVCKKDIAICQLPFINVDRADLGDKDSLYLHTMNAHCIVILYRASDRRCLIADGTNKCINDPEVMSDLNIILNIPIQTARFTQQTGIDHCAASAAAIGCEFLRIYCQGEERPETVVCPVYSNQKIKKAFYRGEPSVLLALKLDLAHSQAKVRCDICGKLPQNRAALFLHKLRAHKK